MTAKNRVVWIQKLMRRSQSSMEAATSLYEKEFYEEAISRAYYAMFYLTQAVLATKDLYRKRHSAVISAFAEHFTNQELLPRDLHTKLHTAFEERLASDYDMDSLKSGAEAQEVLEGAQEFKHQIIPFLQEWLVKTQKTKNNS
ncbi:MAG: HEPN domain-containing protein [bacterium]